MACIYVCFVPPKMHFPTLVCYLNLMLGERHIRHAKVSTKNSASIFYDNCVGHFKKKFLPPSSPPKMTSTNVPLD